MYASKKILTLSIISLIGLGLGGCSFHNNNHHDFHNNNYTYQAKPVTLHQHSMIKTFSVNYYDASSDRGANHRMDHDVDSYLNSVKNSSQYNVDVRTSSVSDEGDENGGQVMVDTVVLTRK